MLVVEMNMYVLLYADDAVVLAGNLNDLQQMLDWMMHQRPKVVVFDRGNGMNDCKLHINCEKLHDGEVLMLKVYEKCKNFKICKCH